MVNYKENLVLQYMSEELKKEDLCKVAVSKHGAAFGKV